MSATIPSRHHEWLDLLRFGAAILVLLAHARGFLFAEYGALEAASRGLPVAVFYAVTQLGHEAVIVFFVLSGYLVGGKVLERVAAKNFEPRSYAIDRATRLWVPLVPALVLSAAVGGGNLITAIGNMLGLQGVIVPMLGGNGPLWSLAYEVWFYAIAYAAARLAMNRRGDALSLAILIAAAVVFTKLSVHYLLCWLAGAWAYWRPHRLPAWAGLSIGAIGATVAIAGLKFVGDGYAGQLQLGPWATPLFEFSLAIVTAVACVSLSAAASNVVTRAAVPLAAFSYTLYLSHYPLLMLIRENGWVRLTSITASALAIYAAVVASCMLVAWLLYLPFERRTELVRRYVKQLPFLVRARVKAEN